MCVGQLPGHRSCYGNYKIRYQKSVQKVQSVKLAGAPSLLLPTCLYFQSRNLYLIVKTTFHINSFKVSLIMKAASLGGGKN